MFLQQYEYEIVHKPGNRMAHMDLLSILVLEDNTFEQTLSIKQGSEIK